MSQSSVVFPCGDIQLEGIWHLPDSEPSPVVIVCHPHPLHGGDMFNNVVTAICQALSQHSVAAFRFNFRGAGNSGGTFGGGITEQEDVKAALAFVGPSPRINSERIGLAGYSFGTSVALPVAVEDERVNLLALVSPALADSGWEQLKGYSRLKFIILGDSDFVIPTERFQQQWQDVPEPRQHEVISGADHFWQGYERELAEKVAQFFTAGFKQA